MSCTVALQPQDGLTGFVIQPQTVLGVDPASRLSVGPEAVQPILSGFQIADSAFQLQRPPGAGESLLLDLHVPRQMAVSVVVGDQVAFAGAVSGPTLIIDGQVDAKSSLPAMRARTLLMLPLGLADELGPDLRADFPGPPPLASTAGLRRHLLSLPSLATPIQGQILSLAGGNAALVVVRIHIDAAGSVTGAQVVEGQDPLAAAAVQSLLGAKFKPFLVNGKAAEVTGLVQYALSDHGNLLDISIQ